ncbi:MAG TPA: DUF3179 domain-containing (seleno)protein [Thermoanaerobaculia bacterium]|nr:DUF3179 domain-containing (seleno)protein [Thermoanaerobaculia bacterium]
MNRFRGIPPLVLLLSVGCFAHQYRDNPRVAIVDGDAIVQMKPPGEMPAALEAPLVPAEKHSDRPDELERVIGLVLVSGPRAYPIGLLDRFEVVNDQAEDVPFVVARCALTGVVAIYSRRVGGRILSFENSGALWRDTLVLRDRETGTYWTAATGRALAGPLAGERLDPIPAWVTRAEIWDRAYPRSLYLDLDRSTAVPFVIRVYQASPAQGVSGTQTSDHRYKPKQELFALRDGDDALALTPREVREHAPIATILDGKRITIEWDATLETPRAYGEAPGREELTLIPMYWFALDRHFTTIRTLADVVAKDSAPETR